MAAYDIPKRQRAVRVVSLGDPTSENVKLKEVDVPKVGMFEVLVKVYASAVNPIDWKIASGYLGLVSPQLPFGLGFDFSGRVVKSGFGSDFKEGDIVWGMHKFTKLSSGGSFGEYLLAASSSMSLKPSNLSHSQAASLPLVALTAYQSLVNAGGLKQGQKVLILGGSGGVGTVAIQIAKAFGASEVVCTCSPRNNELCMQLGADRCIDYHHDWVEEVADEGDYDLVLDAAGAGGSNTWESCPRYIKKNGAFVTIVGDSQETLTLGRLLSVGFTIAGRKLKSVLPGEISFSQVTASTNTADLNVLRRLCESGSLRPILDRSYPLEKINDALLYNKDGHSRGKVVVMVKASSQKPEDQLHQDHHHYDSSSAVEEESHLVSSEFSS